MMATYRTSFVLQPPRRAREGRFAGLKPLSGAVRRGSALEGPTHRFIEGTRTTPGERVRVALSGRTPRSVVRCGVTLRPLLAPDPARPHAPLLTRPKRFAV